MPSRPTLLLILALLTSGGANGALAQRRPPADTTGMMESDGMMTVRDIASGRVDSTGYLVYPDETVGLFYPGRDTVYFGAGTVIGLGMIVDHLVRQAPAPVQTIVDAEVMGGDVQFVIMRTFPIPIVVIGGLLFPALFLGVVVFLVRRLRRERVQRRLLEDAALRLAESREDERRRIARDLHDGPLQDLHALHMQLGLAADALAAREDSPSAESRRVRGAHDEAHTVIGDLRSITEALRPPALGPFGLAAAIRAQAERFRHLHPEIEVDLVLDDDGQTLAEPVRLALFRVVQESLNNAAKHGDPRWIAIELRLTANRAEVDIRNDGNALLTDPNVSELASNGHFGVLGMRERMTAVGGRVAVKNMDGRGVRVAASVPIGL